VAVKLHYSGKWLHWSGDGGDAKFHASSGLIGSDEEGDDEMRMFRVGTRVFVFRLDYRCTWYEKTKNRGPIPTGTYQVATKVKGYASYDASACAIADSYSIQAIPRGGDPNAQPHGAEAGQCEQYWANWGYNRVALAPFRDMVAPHRNGFYLHDSSKGFTHGCVELDQKFFTDKLLPTVKADPKVKITLTVKYEDGFRTYGDTLARGGKLPDEGAQTTCLRALKELAERLAANAPTDEEKPFVAKHKRPSGVTLDPPSQARLLQYDYGLNLSWGANDLSREPDKLAKVPAWWGNYV
jgi:hypothetical protein